jgi:hypothetical protein
MRRIINPVDNRLPQKGALIIEKIEGRKEDDKLRYPLTIEFQFNPDSLKRTLKMVSPQEGPGQQGGAGGSGAGAAAAGGGAPPANNRATDPRDLKNDSNLGESISITAFFDGKENYLGGDLMPVLSILEKLMEPVETKQKDTKAAHVSPPKVVPLVFFWWGERRILPVKITQLSISETEFTPELTPIRAEVGLEMELLVPLSGSDLRIAEAYNYVSKKKSEAAQKYLEKVNQAEEYRKASYAEATTVKPKGQT